MKEKTRPGMPPAEKNAVSADIYVQIEERINTRNAITCKRGLSTQETVKKRMQVIYLIK